MGKTQDVAEASSRFCTGPAVVKEERASSVAEAFAAGGMKFSMAINI